MGRERREKPTVVLRVVLCPVSQAERAGPGPASGWTPKLLIVGLLC